MVIIGKGYYLYIMYYPVEVKKINIHMQKWINFKKPMLSER